MQVIGVQQGVQANIIETLELNPRKGTTNISESQRDYLQNELILAWKQIQPTDTETPPELCQKGDEFEESVAEFLEELDIKDHRVYSMLTFQIRNHPGEIFWAKGMRRESEVHGGPELPSTGGNCRLVLYSIKYLLQEIEGLLGLIDKNPYLSSEFDGKVRHAMVDLVNNGRLSHITLSMPTWENFYRGNFDIYNVRNIRRYIEQRSSEINGIPVEYPIVWSSE